MGRGTLNKVILIGRLGRDPEVKYLPSGQAVATFSIATDESWQSKDGKDEKRTEWHRIVAFGKTGEFCGEYLSKGKLIYAEGRLQTREWEDKNTKQKRSTTEIVVRDIMMLGSKGEGAAKEAVADEEIVYDKPAKTGPGEDVPF